MIDHTFVSKIKELAFAGAAVERIENPDGSATLYHDGAIVGSVEQPLFDPGIVFRLQWTYDDVATAEIEVEKPVAEVSIGAIVLRNDPNLDPRLLLSIHFVLGRQWAARDVLEGAEMSHAEFVVDHLDRWRREKVVSSEQFGWLASLNAQKRIDDSVSTRSETVERPLPQGSYYELSVAPWHASTIRERVLVKFSIGSGGSAVRWSCAQEDAEDFYRRSVLRLTEEVRTTLRAKGCDIPVYSV